MRFWREPRSYVGSIAASGGLWASPTQSSRLSLGLLLCSWWRACRAPYVSACSVGRPTLLFLISSALFPPFKHALRVCCVCLGFAPLRISVAFFPAFLYSRFISCELPHGPLGLLLVLILLLGLRLSLWGHALCARIRFRVLCGWPHPFMPVEFMLVVHARCFYTQCFTQANTCL